MEFTQREFQYWAEGALTDILSLLVQKGSQYSSLNEPALINFDRGSTILDLSPARYLLALVTKQFYALARIVGRENLNASDITERASDIIVYMLLLMSMVRTDPSDLTTMGDLTIAIDKQENPHD